MRHIEAIEAPQGAGLGNLFLGQALAVTGVEDLIEKVSFVLFLVSQCFNFLSTWLEGKITEKKVERSRKKDADQTDGQEAIEKSDRLLIADQGFGIGRHRLQTVSVESRAGGQYHE